MKFDLNKYFDRIGWYPNGEDPCEQLTTLHMRHMISIPFENLDAYLNKSVSLAPDDIYEKIVLKKRGGYCFETNALLRLALDAMGFEVKSCSARVYREGTGYSGYLHRLEIVSIEKQRYLLDVGFGGTCFFTPVLLEEGLIQKQLLNTYRIVRSDQVNFTVQYVKNGEFSDMLGFNDRPAVNEDFEISNYFTSSHPRSFFSGNIVCVIATENGRHSLLNNTLTILENGDSKKIAVTKDNLSNILKAYFNLEDEGITQRLLDVIPKVF